MPQGNLLIADTSAMVFEWNMTLSSPELLLNTLLPSEDTVDGISMTL